MYYYAKCEAKVKKVYSSAEYGDSFMCETVGEHFGQDGFPVSCPVKLFPCKNKTAVDIKEGDTVMVYIGDAYIKKDDKNYTGVKHILAVKEDAKDNKRGKRDELERVFG